jgi:hypothetical protein
MIDCAAHGKGIACVVCRHMLESAEAVVGFVENSSDPHDLQAWCDSCEAMFARERQMTQAFREFNGMALVCHNCYAALKRRHMHTAR